MTRSQPALSRRALAARNDRIALLAVLVLMAGYLGTSGWLLG
jgi:hypothetical protein